MNTSTLARIDATNDEYRAVARSMADGGFEPHAIRHAHHANAGVPCPAYCLTCTHTRVHANCYGCPDC